MAEEYAKQIHRCFNCGFCKFAGDYCDFNCPSYVRFRLDTYSTSGRLWLIRGWLKGELKWSEHLGEILYSCVTCRNCTQNCPMRFSDDIVDWIIAARSDMMEKEKGKIPPRVRDFLENVYNHGNPMKRKKSERDAWAEGIKLYQSSDEYLFYVGCLGSYDELGQSMARNTAQLFNKAGVSFGILGNDEGCCGNEVHNLGETELLRMLAENNISRFREMEVKKIITLSPHSYNIMKNSYPEFGGDFEVYHYTQFLNRLLKEGRIKPSAAAGLRITYHDPCFLGRWNGIYNEPRKILESIPGVRLEEMKRSREDSFCCGGGSGNFAMDLLGGSPESPDRIRVREAHETGAEVLAVACPSCMTMLSEAVKTEGLEEKLVVKDISGILNEAS